GVPGARQEQPGPEREALPFGPGPAAIIHDPEPEDILVAGVEIVAVDQDLVEVRVDACLGASDRLDRAESLDQRAVPRGYQERYQRRRDRVGEQGASGVVPDREMIDGGHG